MKTGGKHLCRFLPIFRIISEPRNRTRLIMIFPEQTVPGNSLETFLPFRHNMLQIPQIHLFIRPLIGTVCIHVHVFKLKNHIQLFFITAGIFLCFLKRHAGTFSHRDRVSSFQYSSSHLLQIFMHMRAVCRLIKAGIAIDPRLSIRQFRLFGDQADHIHPEAVNTFVQPPVHHIIDLSPHPGIIPVKIRLLFGKQMQIIHICCLVIFPGRPGKAGSPVVRLFPLLCRPPDIIIPVWIVF